MAIKAGQILHTANGFLVDRIQSAGPGSINVNSERVDELGNYEAVAFVRDIPDLSFEMETLDFSTELHKVLFGATDGDPAGTKYEPELHLRPVDILSPFKGAGLFEIVRGIAIPYLTVESLTYNFSITDNASLNVGLRGDSIYYVPGDVYREEFTASDIVGGVATFGAGSGGLAGPALKTVIDGEDLYVLGAMFYDASASAYRRLRHGTDFTNTASALTLIDITPAAGDMLWVIYGHATTSQYTQSVHSGVAAGTPAGIRGRNVQVSVDGVTWLGLQSATVEWRATLERDEELGNPQIVSQDFDVPEVSGTLTMRASTAEYLFDRILQAAGVTSPDIVNAVVDPPQLPLQFKIVDPATGDTLQTLEVPDAQFDPVAIQGQVGQKLDVEFPYNSAGGSLDIYKGDKPAGSPGSP